LYVQAENNSDLPFINFSNNGGSFNWGRVGGLLQGDGDGALYFQTKLGGGLTEKMRITSGGLLLVGTTSENSYGANVTSIQMNGVSGSLYETRHNGTSALRVGSASDHSYHHEPRNVEQRFSTNDTTRFYIYANGNYDFTGTDVSDRRAKDNITTLDLTATDKIMSLEAKTYNMKNNPSQIRYGFIAQDVKQIVSDLVIGNDTNGYLGLDYNGLLTLTIKALQEQQKQIEELKQLIKNK